MALLAGTCYDPASSVAKSVTALLAMTAVDTTNLRLTFTAPSTSAVLVRLRANVTGATTWGRIHLGVLDGATVKMRMSTQGQWPANAATSFLMQEAVGVVSGLTPNTSYTWDAAYGVDIVGTGGSAVKYGGADNASANDAFGGFVYEVWDTAHLLGSCLYDPSSAAAKSLTAALAMTALDTTNLRVTFTAPSTSAVMWRIHTQQHGSTTTGSQLLGVLDGSVVKGRVAPIKGMPETSLATSCVALEASGVVTGLTPNTSYTWDAAYGVETVMGAGGAIKYGGPDNTTTNDAFGATAFEVWAA